MASTAAISRFKPVRHERPQQAQVALLDVAAVLAQVDGDAVGAAEQGQHRRRHGVGFVRPPRLPQRGDVVDVDAEPDHVGASRYSPLSPVTRGEGQGVRGGVFGNRPPSPPTPLPRV